MKKELKIKIDKKNFSLKALSKFFISFLNERFKILAFLIVAVGLFFLVFVWYSYIFQADWSEAEVQKYIQAKQAKSDTTFNQKNFQQVIEESNNRRAEFERTLSNLPDIFRLKK